ncbi:MAG: vitamin K epoxide reductase family protein [Cyanobacteria bacterium]|nr:vitamin K epoxide reductase family protein [Cyanobacteriota bacterium]
MARAERRLEEVRAAGVYTCPMHPEVRQDRPGTCPKCGMALVPQRGGESPAEDHAPDHMTMLREMRAPWLWTNAAVMMLGLWLVSSPFTFGYRSAAMMWSDIASGVLLVAFAGMALAPRFDFVGRWSVSLVGVWLQFAPLIFWAPTAAAYLNDTLVGALAITLSILVPMMPGMAHHMAMMKPGPEIPPGWSYNPSSWHQRMPMVGLGLIGWLISRYLAAYQLGYIGTIWEPFFGAGTHRVLTSEVSQMWPISDAGLGATAYTLEVLMAWMGGRTRWRTMPWMVTFFFILVVPLGLTHIVLVILQPVVVGEWCTLCLAAAALMMIMIPFTVDEVIAMGQFMRERVRAGKPFWWTFWAGDTMEGGSADERTPRYGAQLPALLPAASWGVSVPWSLVASTAVGLWLMFAPWALGSDGRAADSDNLVGALILTVAVISAADVVRALRWLNLLFGLWLLLAPWVLTGASAPARWSDMAAGAAVIALSVPRGIVRERYGAWDAWVV